MKGSPTRQPCLPGWFKEEETLRRMLLMRRDGHSIGGILDACGATRSQWARVRVVAAQGKRPGDAKAAAAFLARFDAFGRGSRAPDMFSPQDGAKLAEKIARWKINGASMHPKEGKA